MKISLKFIRAISLASLAPLLLLGILIVYSFLRSGQQLDHDGITHGPTLVNQVKAAKQPALHERLDPVELQAAEQANKHFQGWIAAYSTLPNGSPDRAGELQKGLLFAKERKPYIEALIATDPRQALALSLRFDQWAMLPDEIKAEVEKPFSVTGSYTYHPICRDPGAPPKAGEPAFFASLGMPDGSHLRAFPYGRRDGVFSKRELPVQGITLSGMAALRDGPLQILSAGELEAVKPWFANSQADMGRSLVTGEPVGNDAVYALAGGRLYAFSSKAEAEELDARLAEFDQKPGPFAASSLLPNPVYANTDGSLNLRKVEDETMAQTSVWTETKKKLFLIRVNFTDRPEEPVSLSSVESVMTQSSENIRRMSYGKTWVEAKASANVYTLPQTLAYYSTSPSILATEPMLMRDARNTFRQQKTGADAAVDIGPVSAATYGDGGGLGDYDIVGVYRCTTDGEGAGGGAGGSYLLMKGAWANTIRVFTHEWGHNYGLGHSSLWKTTDGSVAGNGTTDEYGDTFDLMGDGRMPEGHFHPEGKVRLNWLPAAQWVDADASGSGTYRISRIDDTATPQNIHGVRVARGGNGTVNGYYWIAHRFAYADNPRLQNGAYLVWQRPGQNRSWLLDATPGSAGQARDSTFAMGSTFADPLSHAFITPLGTGGTDTDSYLDVRVNLGPFPNNTPPQATEISGPLTVQARTPVTFSVTGSDANSDPLAYSWETGESTLRATPNSPVFKTSWCTGGTYPLKVTVSDMKGGTIQKTVNVQVLDPLDHPTAGYVGRAVTMMDARSGNGVVMGLGYWGELFRSWDGVNWTEVKHNTGLLHWTRLAFGNGVFVMSGHRDGETTTRIAYSADGQIWTMAQVPEGTPIARELAFGGGKFVGVSDGGAMLWSADGMNWNRTQVAESPDFRCLAWNGSTWLATAVNRSNLWWETSVDPSNDWWDAVWTSSDGVNWQQRPSIGVAGERVLGHNGVFYFLTWYGGLIRSTDNGVTWQNTTLPAENPVWSWSVRNACVAEDGTMIATAIEHLATGNQLVPLVSMDGIRWNRSTSESIKSAVVGANNLAFGAGRMLVMGNDGVVHYSEPLAPDNLPPVISATAIGGTTNARGVTTLSARASDPEGKPLRYFWDFGPIHPIDEGASAEIILPFGGSYQVTLRVIDANGGLTSSTQTISIADPAISFTTRTSGATNNLVAIAANDTVAVAVGDANHPILTSTNGSTWTKRTLPEWTYLHDIVWDGGKFIATGHGWRNSVWNNVIYTSSDGITWTRRFTAVAGTQLVRSLAAGPGAGAVAVGDNGLCLRSADGITWSTLVIPALGTLGATDVTWGPAGFVMTAVSYSPTTVNKVFTSPNGITWTDRSAGTGLDAEWKTLLRTSWLHDRYVSTGWYSGIRSSFDGGSTFAQARTAGNIELRSMAYGNGVYFGAGWDRDNSGVDVDVFSLNGDDWYSFIPRTTNDRLGAVFFKDTFITVGETGEIRQSGPVVRPQEVFAFRRAGPVVWDSVQSETRHAFLALPGQTRIIEYATDLAGPWQTLEPIETGPLGNFEATFRQNGDQRATWGKRMFFRLRK